MNEPIPTERRMMRAWHYYEGDQFRECERLCREVLAEDPTHGGALYLSGHCALALGEFDRAAGISRDLLNAHPESGAAHQLAGVLSWRRGRDPVGTEDHLRRATRFDPEGSDFHASLASFLGTRGRYEEGITVAWQARKRDPENPHVLAALQTLYRLNDEPDMAEKIGAEALRLDPEHSEFHLEAGLRLLERRETGAARHTLREALRLAPADGDARDVMAHQRVASHPLFKNGFFLSFAPGILIPALLTPTVWYGLSFLWRPFLWLDWASVALLVVAYVYHGLFLVCRRHVRRRIERGRA